MDDISNISIAVYIIDTSCQKKPSGSHESKLSMEGPTLTCDHIGLLLFLPGELHAGCHSQMCLGAPLLQLKLVPVKLCVNHK